MGKGLSEDLRWRVISAVEAGMSCRGAAARFGVSASGAVRGVREWRESGRTAPRRQGGDRPSGRVEAHADVLLAGEAAPDRTLEELRALLIRARGRGQQQHDLAVPRPVSHTARHRSERRWRTADDEKKPGHASEQDRDDVRTAREARVSRHGPSSTPRS